MLSSLLLTCVQNQRYEIKRIIYWVYFLFFNILLYSKIIYIFLFEDKCQCCEFPRFLSQRRHRMCFLVRMRFFISALWWNGFCWYHSQLFSTEIPKMTALITNWSEVDFIACWKQGERVKETSGDGWYKKERLVGKGGAEEKELRSMRERINLRSPEEDRSLRLLNLLQQTLVFTTRHRPPRKKSTR